MTTALLDISGKLDAGTIAIYRDVAEVAESLTIDYLVVGASGRDLILRYAYDVQVQRATNDYNFAFEVGNLSEYEDLRTALLEKGFKQTSQYQRLVSPQAVNVDLVPFGEFADEAGNITLPPDHHHKMNVLGFAEALADAQLVRISPDPPLEIPVVSMPGLILLKLIAWCDRPRDRRAKDAQDFRYVIDSYSRLPADVYGIWDEADCLEKFNGDIELVAAAFLGHQTRSIAGEASSNVVQALLAGEQLDAFVLDMGARFAAIPSKNAELTEAFRHGFNST